MSAVDAALGLLTQVTANLPRDSGPSLWVAVPTPDLLLSAVEHLAGHLDDPGSAAIEVRYVCSFHGDPVDLTRSPVALDVPADARVVVFVVPGSPPLLVAAGRDGQVRTLVDGRPAEPPDVLADRFAEAALLLAGSRGP